MVGFKNRYMVMEVFIDPNKDISKDDPIILSQHNISKAIKDSILVNFGECGLASSLVSFQVKYVNHITKVCIIRASRDEHQKVWAAITMVRSVGNCPVVFNLLDLSGEYRWQNGYMCQTGWVKLVIVLVKNANWVGLGWFDPKHVLYKFFYINTYVNC
ncbi:putative ribonuclease P [Helianthus annuus]|nr:putative ribonuclease P [Helianthus annuus]KAJ0776298.1 putative ribonuclease P [Helianthus annuus]